MGIGFPVNVQKPSRIVPFFSGYLYAIAVAAGLWLHGFWVLLPVVLTFGIVPLFDGFAGLSQWNPPPGEERALQRNSLYRLVTFGWLPIAAVLTVCAIARAADPSVGWAERIGLALGLGFTNGIGIIYAHELVHRSGRTEPLLGEAMLSLVSYPHFRIEHVFGHHRFVATPRDPATARYGEDVYRFMVRSVIGQIRSAWQLETEQLARRGRGVWAFENRMLVYALVMLLIYAAVYAAYGTLGAAFFALQSAVAFGSLEIVNYLEHYGLMRREIEPGTYEPVRPQHSWNSAHRASGWIYLNLPRHSDHHARASHRYQTLVTYPSADVPQLPFGYPVMYVFALIPPLWFATMNPRARFWRETAREAA